MNFSRFFIDRPIFAAVLSIFIFIAGAISLINLPVSEYPEVVPPTVVVSAQFPGANPSTIAETVSAPLEESINGVENMLYMSSISASDGGISLTITFKIGTDPDLAQQLVQNRVSQALPRLPDIVRQLGVTVAKSSPDLSMVVHLTSPTGKYDILYLRNYGNLNVKDEIARVPGVGQAELFGSGNYAMRVWLDPDRIAERKMNAEEVVNAIRSQNVQVAAGVIGGPPYGDSIEVQMPVNTQGRLETPEEFENVIIKRDENGVITRLRDVARVELSAQSYGLRSLLNNEQAVAVVIFAAPGANALELSKNVREKVAELSKNFPEGMEYSIVYDPTVFVKDSIKAVIKTLLEAVALVVLVVIVFLQTWRASIIPLLAVPVSVVGTFAFMSLFGYSINVLSLFGLILSIGIVVDDAIVVVENVERNIEKGLTPHDATVAAMKEVTSPIIATGLVLTGVFVPIAFISGLTGQFYQQFAMTIAIATVISTFNSLTLSPALSALLLKGHHAKPDALTRFMNFTLGWFFNGFNKLFGRATNGYERGVTFSVRRKLLMMLVYGALLGVTFYSFKIVPPGFVPAQDKQYLIGFAQLPQGATLDRTEAVIRKMTDIAMKQPGVASAVAFPGLSINGFVNSPSAGIVFVTLDDFKDRDHHPDQNAGAIAGALMGQYMGMDDAFVAIFPPPPVMGLGTVGGFKLQIEDRTDQGYQALDNTLKAVLGAAWQNPALANVFSGYNINSPQIYADLDRTKALQRGVAVQDIFSTMQVYLGSYYVNDFNQFGRTYQVIAQADRDFRGTAEDIARLQVRNATGEMVPLGALMDIKETFGPETAVRYNGFRSADVSGDAAPGFSSGQAQAAISQILAETLPPGMAFEWTDLTYQQILAGNSSVYIFPLCILFVFLILAALYESLTLPLAVIMIVPMSIMSALIGVKISGGDNNIFTQISLFVLAGLACKNAILIVEFARELEHQGRTIVAAAIEASRLRLRPILMTSFAFIMGVVPLVLSHGAGAEMRHAIGVAVFSGMLGVTLFGIFLTPVFYVLLRQLEAKIRGTTAMKWHDNDKDRH